jgi:predicted metalloprotease with PDZ domain
MQHPVIARGTHAVGTENAASRLPQPLPRPHNVPEPEDRPYPGSIKLAVDATDVLRRVFHVREIVPVASSGPFTLLYPEWLPGFHSPRAPIDLMAGLTVTANGRRVSWQRDPVNVYAFHLDIPPGATELELCFQYLAPTDSSQDRVTVTAEILDLQWNTILLHPAGYFARNVMVDASVRLPHNWSYACALREESRSGETISFERSALDVLVDSPVYAGRYRERIMLARNVHLNIFAERPEYTTPSEDQIGACRHLVQEARELFGAEHYDRYEFLVALSSEIESTGIEHHRSCEIAAEPDLFASWEKNLPAHDVLAHEFVHSWNGKYRRGSDSWQPCFHLPIRNSLMWVYEGLTQYLGQVLCARSGIWSKDDFLQALAEVAGDQLTRRGRIWRSMQDTTADPIIAERGPLPWTSWQRSEDYYSDGELMWLEVDMMIRHRTDQEKSLDDFAKLFFGMNDGEWITNTYEYCDVVSALSEVLKHDWQDYFAHRLNGISGGPPLNGIAMGGYQLIFKDEQSDFASKKDALAGTISLVHSLGLRLKEDGKVSECVWESPAFQAGMTAGSRIIAVNGRKFSPDELQLAVSRTAEGRFVHLAFEQGNHVFEQLVPYEGGPRHPHLVPDTEHPLLDCVVRSRTGRPEF